jgi:hypothetical protein
MWELAPIVLQVACLAILVAAALVSIGLRGSTKPRMKGPNRG